VKNPVARTVFAADLGGTKLTCAIVSAVGKILARQTESLDASTALAPVEQICRTASELAAQAARGARARRGQPGWVAAGIAVPGLVRRSGTVWAPNLPGWENIPLARLLGRRLGVPVVVESDRNAAVVGEVWRGAGRGKTDVIALAVGTGIGAGILSGGVLVRGAHELSGCAGWMAVTEKENDDFLRWGCLEALAAGPAIARAARKALALGANTALRRRRAETITALDVADAARDGDAVSKEIFHRIGKVLGLAVANLISLFDPQVVVIGGGLAGAGDLYFDRLKRTALERCQPLAARRVRVQLSRLGPDANLLGAARLALLKIPAAS